MEYFSIDRSKFPIVITKLSPITPTEEQFDAFLNHLENLLSAKKVFAGITLMDKGNYLPFNLRLKLNKWMKNNRENLLLYQSCIVFVNSSLITNMVLKGIFLMNPPPTPYTITKNMDAAYEFAYKHIKRLEELSDFEKWRVPIV